MGRIQPYKLSLIPGGPLDGEPRQGEGVVQRLVECGGEGEEHG